MKKTLAATLICKNERHNIERVLTTLRKCGVDHVYMTDTGSTDGTLEFLLDYEASYPTFLTVLNFKWIDDFAAARNYALPVIQEDYWLWLDLDDTIETPEVFKIWKETAMHIHDQWLAPYIYASTPDGKPACTFIRERVFKNGKGFKFTDFIHEAVPPIDGIMPAAINSWVIKHVRTEDEKKADDGRNLSILDKKKDQLSTRLKFYYGKELFDAGKHEEAMKILSDAASEHDLNFGDRILCMQYLVHACIQCKKYDAGLAFAFEALKLDPTRAEIHCFIGDIYLVQQDWEKALPFFNAATGCKDKSASGLQHTFSFSECYGNYPKTQMAKIFHMLGDFEGAIDLIKDVETPEGRAMLNDLWDKLKLSKLKKHKIIKNEDIVISCPAGGAYPWNDKIAKERGLGGSETAAVEMAKELSLVTRRNVVVFCNTPEEYHSSEGFVQYRKSESAYEYFSKWEPKLHIAWRHNFKLTDAPTYIWSHDLITPGCEQLGNYNKILALSEFHKNYLRSLLGIPEDKFLVTRNGITPSLFYEYDVSEKDENMIIWPNSPDRGLEFAIEIVERVRNETGKPLELHCYYGLENLEKYGLKAKSDMLKKLISERPWVKYHGSVKKEELMRAFSKAVVWLYPADFLETFCISALEAVFNGCYPLTATVGALPYTMKEFIENGKATILDRDYKDELGMKAWTNELQSILENKKWMKLIDAKINIEKYSWKSVAEEWAQLFDLK